MEYSKGRWVNSSGSANTQKAEILAKGYVGNSGGSEVRIHGLDGKIRDIDNVGPGKDPRNIKDTKHQGNTLTAQPIKFTGELFSCYT